MHDNAGLYHALRSGHPVLPVFIFDTEILDDLEEKKDRRVVFIHDMLHKLQEELAARGSTIHVLHGKPVDCFRKLLDIYTIAAVYTNNDYEPYALRRDNEVASFLRRQGVEFKSYKDQVIFEKNEIVKDNREPYTVYTPYNRKWKAALNDFYLKSYPTEACFHNLYTSAPQNIPSLESLGFAQVSYDAGPMGLSKEKLNNYETTRDYPALDSTTHLSVHLRFGTISVRELVSEAKKLNEKLLDEIIWREFYQMILWHFPKVVTQAFKEEYDHIQWRNNEAEFEKWCKGETGFPIVDAGMRELNATGYMHNRVRLIVASFLVKDLLIDWRWGEAYFAEKLLD